MGKKYVVEIGRLERLYKASTSAKGMPNITWLSPEVDLTPYTEPDLEQVRMGAYEDGYKTAKIQCGIQAEKDLREVGERHYQRGLSDAWEAAKKLEFGTDKGGIPTDTIAEIFGTPIPNRVLRDFTASEAVEKIRQYEQEKEKKEKHHTWICSEAGEPSTDITLICSKCGYAITLKLGDTQALNFCPKCGDDKRGEQE